MKILFIGHDSTLYGAQKCFLETSVALKDNNNEVIAVLPYKGELNAKLSDKKINSTIYNTPWWVGYEKLGFLKKAVLIKQIIKSFVFFLD